MLKANGVTDRRVWAADSFEGLPAPDVEKYPADEGADWHLRPLTEVGVAQVRRNFDRYGLLDDQTVFLRGWFKDTLPTAPIDRIAVLRLDGDLYESTMDALRPCTRGSRPAASSSSTTTTSRCAARPSATIAEHGITDEIVPIDDAGVYWRKTTMA